MQIWKKLLVKKKTHEPKGNLAGQQHQEEYNTLIELSQEIEKEIEELCHRKNRIALG